MLIREGLDQYVRRILSEKDLTLNDVERISDGLISDSYLSNIINGKMTNLTINKLKALAQGLGVEESQVFLAACGISFPEDGEIQKSEFAKLFYKYIYLKDEDKKEIDTILDMLGREIDLRLMNRMRMPIDSGLERTVLRTTSTVESDSPR